MAKHEISNSDDVIDSRDVIARIEELEGERETFLSGDVSEEHAAAVTSGDMTADQAKQFSWDETDGGRELKALQSLQEEAEGYADDWRHGAALIRDSYFVDYCEEMLKDIGDLPKDLPHYIAIDWEKTAENLQVDYTSVEYDGVTYWVR